MAAVVNMAEARRPARRRLARNLYVDGGGDWHIMDDGGNDRTLMTTDTELATAGLADAAVTNAKNGRHGRIDDQGAGG